MTKDVVVKEVDLAVFDTGEKIDGEVAWEVARHIKKKEIETRLGLGKFWNACKHGTREEICDSMGWKYRTMKRYGMYAEEQKGPVGPLPFSHWRNAKKAGIPSEDRSAFLEAADKKGWTPKQITNFSSVRRLRNESYKR